MRFLLRPIIFFYLRGYGSYRYSKLVVVQAKSIMFGYLIVLIIVVWCWTFLLNHPNAKKLNYADIADSCKTGDLILFHALDNINALFIGGYYTHVGIVYRATQRSRPYIFEAWNPTESDRHPADIARGIALSDLENRIQSYRGYVFYKPLIYPVPQELSCGFYTFIKWALANMHYHTRVISNGASKLLLNDGLRVGTNCGELVYLSLIKLGLLNQDRIRENRKHHLNWVCSLANTDNGNAYAAPLYLWQDYFLLPHINEN